MEALPVYFGLKTGEIPWPLGGRSISRHGELLLLSLRLGDPAVIASDWTLIDFFFSHSRKKKGALRGVGVVGGRRSRCRAPACEEAGEPERAA